MQTVTSFGIGHNQPPPNLLIRKQPDLGVVPALIFPRRRLERTAGRARAAEWVLRVERQRPPALDPLTGWTGGDDPLAQVELTFPSRAEAIRHAEREGLAWRIVDGHLPSSAGSRTIPQPARGSDGSIEAALGTVMALSSLLGVYGTCNLPGMPELDEALVNPAAVFASPDEVVRHPLLTIGCKREILWRWAWDEYLLDLAAAEGMPEGEPSRLSEVKAALRLVNMEWNPDPAAPAAFALAYDASPLFEAA
jgi:hypothetical protein